MPFEISPKIVEAPAKVGRFEKYADAILRGCAATGPWHAELCNWPGTHTCAYGAMYVGMGMSDPEQLRALEHKALPAEIEAMRQAYMDRYRAEIVWDNDDRKFTREEIAERIRAL